MQERRSLEISALERRAIAPHRGDVTTVRAAERLKARAAESPRIIQQQQSPQAAQDPSPTSYHGSIVL